MRLRLHVHRIGDCHKILYSPQSGIRFFGPALLQQSFLLHEIAYQRGFRTRGLIQRLTQILVPVADSFDVTGLMEHVKSRVYTSQSILLDLLAELSYRTIDLVDFRQCHSDGGLRLKML